MKITDIEGKEIIVTDLDLAIMQADDYRHYRHIYSAHTAGDLHLKTYWEDVYQKLLKLQNE